MNRFALSLACLCLLAPTLVATSISFVGIETGTAVENWSNTSEPKSQDLNGDDRFGGAGYYQITPGAVGNTWNDVALAGNDLGLTQNYPTLADPPSFLSGTPSGTEGVFINQNGSPYFKDPVGTEFIRPGALWPGTTNQIQGNLPGDVLGIRSGVITFTLGQSASFRIGVAVDTLADSYYAPDYVSIFNSSTGESFSAQLSCDGVPDMVFFDIIGTAGDLFEVALWKVDDDLGLGTDSRGAIALLTFDQAPTPTLTYTQNGGSITLSWEQNIPGWILQSSTDLGVTDAWDTVPDVTNNSVIVSMAGTPKNFFRLKKNP